MVAGENSKILALDEIIRADRTREIGIMRLTRRGGSRCSTRLFLFLRWDLRR